MRFEPMQKGDPRAIVAKLDTALTSVFTEEGKRAVMYHLNARFGLTLERASTDPASLETAFTGMLGATGWTVVKRAIMEEFLGEKAGAGSESASLREAFGFIHGFGLFAGTQGRF